ncbi:MAG: BrnT family toxin [Sphingomonas sp.]|uniref:BrnT family toxin n=1 Tax=Sphingomonas sp. TaxID=28214 RepID=UPI0034196615|nr:BrnT family toxin [Sphingomonas sp.]
MRISYDEKKRQKTLKHRQLDFEDAPRIFAGVHLTDLDDRFDYDEDREITIGLLGDKVIVVVWVQRGDCHHIISMREAERDEQDNFYRALGRPG